MHRSKIVFSFEAILKYPRVGKFASLSPVQNRVKQIAQNFLLITVNDMHSFQHLCLLYGRFTAKKQQFKPISGRANKTFATETVDSALIPI